MFTIINAIPGAIGEVLRVDVYRDENRPDRQEKVGQGYPLNPVLRENFVFTPHHQRVPAERTDWWDLPYIQSMTWEQSEVQSRQALQAWDDGLNPIEFEARIKAHKESFFAFNPSGTKYTVYCLDGGAWDRPTRWGCFPTLEEAIERCDNGPLWRRCKQEAALCV